MLRILPLFLLLPLAGMAVFAQSATPGTIQATGTATVNAKPDQVQLDVTVITQGSTAALAGQANATQTNAMIASLQKVLGTSGTIETVGYSLYPRYSTTTGQSSTIIGYTAQNTVRATSFDLSLAGSLIDTANQGGAGSVGGLTFGLQDPEPTHLQALTLAAKQAQAHATAMAAGVGAKTGSVLSAVEGSANSVVPIYAAGGASSSTPVVSGTVSVSATVTITVQLLQ
ncbi:MAG TPA: SIMPL domain-containing protein [Candidatus Sulfopaludibacter sp.]|nr:SIMPL domain-containing protein [Candidatus Sulfopaludibacter sp.]